MSSNTSALASYLARNILLADRSVLSEEKKVSMADVVPDVAETAHADDDLVDLQAKKLRAGVLATLVRVL